MSGIRIVDNRLEIVSEPPVELEPETIAEPEPAPEVTLEPEVAIEILDEPEPEIIEVTEPQVALAPAPEEVLVSEEQKVEEILQTLDLSGINFLFGSDEITQEGIEILNDVVIVLNKHPEFNVKVEGHTDNVGDEELNLSLSQQRALSVMNYLISQGIDTERLNAIGYGESEPITSNSTPEGRATNRRIEFDVARRQ